MAAKTARLETMPPGVPTTPGVYLMRDARDVVLYVGKANNLRARVRSYFQSEGDGRLRIPHLMARVTALEWVVTGNEKEALILENNLIKKFQPRYNVKLKDDKTWLSVKLTTRSTWARVMLVRRWREDGDRYFGPYLNGLRARSVERLIREAFQLRNCTDGVFRAHNKRPCIQFNMGNCTAPCVGYVTEEEYADQVRQVIRLLEGRDRGMVRELTTRMEAAAAELRFEDAARLRDRIGVVRRLAEQQRVQRAAGEDRDVFGLYRDGDVVTVAMLPVRDGRVEDPQAFTFHEVLEEDGEVLERVALQLYREGLPAAPELLVPARPPEPDALAEILGEQAGRKVRIRVAQRGKPLALLQLANENARSRHQAAVDRREQVERGLIELRKRLHLPDVPHRIECYDISHLSGQDTVASMVVLEDGKPLKKGYRLFGIRGLERPDDYAAMSQVMARRLARVDRGWRLPDLLLMDGGKGQLNMAVEAARAAGLQVPIASLAKPDAGELEANPDATDKVYLPGRKNPVKLPAHSPGLLLLQRVRDEAHRFAVQHQRKKRKKRTLSSELDSIQGVGPGRRRALLRHFGSLKRLRQASADEVAAVPGIGPRLARVIVDQLADRAR